MEYRQGTPQDAFACGAICFSAFQAMANQHGLPSEFPTLDGCVAIISSFLSHAAFFSVIAQDGDKIIGSNFLDTRAAVAGVGPISVDPSSQNVGVGKRLMQIVINHAKAINCPIRLHTAAHHGRSVSLYSRLGFKVEGVVALMHGPSLTARHGGAVVRAAQLTDLDATAHLCEQVHGHSRTQEMAEAIPRGTATVAQRDGAMVGYTTGIAFGGHTVGRTNDDIKALLAATSDLPRPGFLLPASNHDLLTWCLQRNLRIVSSMVHMVMGPWHPPNGVYLPSVLY